ncbi:unnamed protein product [Vitrella brassicaformis CCMP3155]|uniref:Uncharacterized protein n=1 Tax=Vitrella brassicaformis (strain CCMP3155) TaxID=1169540 RepID=A0A0G4GX16_VITBC|nr:unnamed protein product [Vitrella brassicaformis CCMP3155]|mmetsp:Transcript_9570/g.23420  ORF Transcript_9570/g.23420 Transcript_9570/m.23420 type:complete len:199 (-) Transcript_9570:1025-1621(-)|eukprot:CEM35459.1 unnamed protein product [Vitrella brassicaformis CCMP3155]
MDVPRLNQLESGEDAITKERLTVPQVEADHAVGSPAAVGLTQILRRELSEQLVDQQQDEDPPANERKFSRLDSQVSKDQFLEELDYVREAILTRKDIYTYMALAPSTPHGPTCCSWLISWLCLLPHEGSLSKEATMRATQRPIHLNLLVNGHPLHYWLIYRAILCVQWIAPLIVFTGLLLSMIVEELDPDRETMSGLF